MKWNRFRLASSKQLIIWTLIIQHGTTIKPRTQCLQEQHKPNLNENLVQSCVHIALKSSNCAVSNKNRDKSYVYNPLKAAQDTITTGPRWLSEPMNVTQNRNQNVRHQWPIGLRIDRGRHFCWSMIRIPWFRVIGVQVTRL